jgi:hypothetical protein
VSSEAFCGREPSRLPPPPPTRRPLPEGLGIAAAIRSAAIGLHRLGACLRLIERRIRLVLATVLRIARQCLALLQRYLVVTLSLSDGVSAAASAVLASALSCSLMPVLNSLRPLFAR